MKRAALFVFLLVIAATGALIVDRSHDALSEAASASNASEPQQAAAEGARRPVDGIASAAPRAATTPPAAPARSVATSPLPPIDAPIAPHLDELRRRARDGDAHAACRLAMTLDACAQMPALARYTERRNAAQAALGVRQHEADNPRGIGAYAAQLKVICEGVAPLDASEAFRWQVVAAESGNRESLYRAGAQPALRIEAILDHVDEWRAWRDHAVEYLQRALAAGDERAADALASLYSPGRSWGLPQVVEPDAKQAYVYARVRTRIAEAAAVPPMRLAMYVADEGGDALTPQQRAAAEREADALFERHFSGRSLAEPMRAPFDMPDFAACEK